MLGEFLFEIIVIVLVYGLIGMILNLTLGGEFGAIIFTLLLIHFILDGFELYSLKKNLYEFTCSEEQKSLEKVTCNKGNVKVAYDNGDIKYEFLLNDKNSTK